MKYEYLFYICFFSLMVVFSAITVPKWFIIAYTILGCAVILYLARKKH